MKHEFVSFETRELASAHAAMLVGARLGRCVEDNGFASLMVSGGSTPAGMFSALSGMDLPWHRVTIGLVDERWVGPEDPRSNERLVREQLLRSKAGAAGFIPMKTTGGLPRDGVEDRNGAYAPHCRNVDVISLGMGSDGHTASWFPGSVGLEQAMAADGPQVVAAIDAAGCPVAGDVPHRMTLTGGAVASAGLGVMLLFGEEKRDVFEAALDASELDMPVKRAIGALGPRLTVIWAA